MNDIVLITRDDCTYCENAKTLLGNNNYTYTEKKIGQDIDREVVVELYPTQKLLPVVIINDRLIGGYLELLDWVFPPAWKDDKNDVE